MNDDQRDRILKRLDKRTARVDQHLDQLDDRLESAEDDVDSLKSDVRRNSVILKGGGTFLTAVGLWFSDKLTRIL